MLYSFVFWKGIERDSHLTFQSDCKCDFDQSDRTKFSVTVTEVVILTLTIKITRRLIAKKFILSRKCSMFSYVMAMKFPFLFLVNLLCK